MQRPADGGVWNGGRHCCSARPDRAHAVPHARASSGATPPAVAEHVHIGPAPTRTNLSAFGQPEITPADFGSPLETEFSPVIVQPAFCAGRPQRSSNYLSSASRAMKQLTPEALHRHLASGKRGGVFFLFGDEEFLKDEATDALIAAHLDPATRDFNYDELRAGGTRPRKRLHRSSLRHP